MHTPSPIPVCFDPIFKSRPWGGRRLAELLGKRLPDAGLIGESWELVSLPGDESRVRGGSLAGVALAELVQRWGVKLQGSAALVEGRFPLLIKFLDARENLSIQVHPKPTHVASGPAAVGTTAAIKHEAWYVIDAVPGAELYIGFQDGVTAGDAARAAGRREFLELLRVWPARAGQCFYLPSGTPHALGAGIVVAEVQTPSDVTYRLYDWDRLGADGRPRALHLDEALRNLRFDVAVRDVVQAHGPHEHSPGDAMRLVDCASFTIDRVRGASGAERAIESGGMAVWIVLSGGGRLRRGGDFCPIAVGDTILIPAENAAVSVQWDADWDLLAVRLPY